MMSTFSIVMSIELLTREKLDAEMKAILKKIEAQQNIMRKVIENIKAILSNNP